VAFGSMLLNSTRPRSHLAAIVQRELASRTPQFAQQVWSTQQTLL
jgi:hypothetical protein